MPRNTENVCLSGKSGSDADIAKPTRLTRPIADARGLLLRSTFKQPVADLLRYKALRPLPCLVIVAAEREELPEHDALGCRIDGYRTLGAAFVGRAWHFSEVADQANDVGS